MVTVSPTTVVAVGGAPSAIGEKMSGRETTQTNAVVLTDQDDRNESWKELKMPEGADFFFITWGGMGRRERVRG